MPCHSRAPSIFEPLLRVGRLARLLLLAAAVLPVSYTASADSSYLIGNSLTWDMYVPGLQQIASNFGVSLQPGYHIRTSHSLVYILNNPTDATIASPSIWPTALPAQTWNFVTFEPYPDPVTPSTLQTDITAAQTFIGLTPNSSTPAPVFYIYEAWPDQNAFLGNYDAYWNQPIPNDLNQYTLLARHYFDALLQRLTAYYGNTVTIRVIPIGDVLARMNELINRGQFQGASTIIDFYRDTYHMGSAGRFMAAITAFATLYGRKPEGAPFSLYQQFNDGNVSLTPEIAAELEGIVWDVVASNSARTGVNPLAVSPAALAFEDTSPGSSSAIRTVTISNTTSLPAAIDAIETTGNFVQTSTCGNSLAGSALCTVSVTFAPGSAGSSSGTLSVHSGAARYEVGLSGSAPVTSSITASQTAATVGKPMTLNWIATSGSACQAESDSASSPWSGAIPPSGSRTLTEASAGAVSYSIHCSASGVQDSSATISVTWSWPPVDLKLTAMPDSIPAGGTTTISWSSSNATDCSAAGGGTSDGWSGSKSTSGSQSLREAPAADGGAQTLVLSLTCRSSASGLSKTSSVSITQSAPPRSGGGGAFDAISALLVGLLVLAQVSLRSRIGHRPPVTSSAETLIDRPFLAHAAAPNGSLNRLISCTSRFKAVGPSPPHS